MSLNNLVFWFVCCFWVCCVFFLIMCGRNCTLNLGDLQIIFMKTYMFILCNARSPTMFMNLFIAMKCYQNWTSEWLNIYFRIYFTFPTKPNHCILLTTCKNLYSQDSDRDKSIVWECPWKFQTLNNTHKIWIYFFLIWSMLDMMQLCRISF